MSIPIIKTEKLLKSYPGVIALNSVDFELMPGEVHIIFGENGAGKSTLISMLSGSASPTTGTINFDGVKTEFSSVKQAQQNGIYTVFQEFSLVPTMTVAENLFLGIEPKMGPFIQRREMNLKTHEALANLGFDINPNRLVSLLTRAEQQMVEIAKALMGELRVLILDEPTASLTDREVQQLFKIIRDLKAKGVGIIYISHRMQEFDEIGDRITILRDGAKVTTIKVKDTSESDLVTLMTGREISEIYPLIERNPGDVILKVKDLNAVGVLNVNFEVCRGEILGVAGLVGSGKSRLWRVILGLGFGISGDVIFKNKSILNKSTKEILNGGIHYLSPDRKHEGLDLAKTSNENLGIDLVMNASKSALSLVNWKAIRASSEGISDKVELVAEYRPKIVSQLSGGNQQKVLFGKCFAKDADLYVFDEPTVGVDMGTRTALYKLIKSIAESGSAVVVISSDLPEVMNLSHRLMVLSQGVITAMLDQSEINEETVLKHFFKEKETS